MKKALAILFALAPSLAWGQGAVLQNGPIIKFDLPGWVQDKTIMSGGKLFTDNFRGFNPSHFFDNHGPGVCVEDALTNGPYHQFCFGHDASGNAQLTVNAVNGAAAASFGLSINGVPQSLIGITTGAPQVVSNVALKATPASTYPFVTRTAFATAGDSPAVSYYSSPSSCAANGLADDNGKCAGSPDGGSWIANLKGLKPTPKIWGCAGNGTTNDATCFQAAVTAMGAASSKLYVGGGEIYKLNTGISSAAQGFELVCENRYTVGGGGVPSGLRAGAINLNLLTMSGFNPAIRDCYFDMSNNGTQSNTVGAAITMSGLNSTIEEVNVYGHCIGIDISGNVGTIDKSRITFPNSSPGCPGIRMGHATQNGTSVDLRVNNTIVECPTCSVHADDGIRIEDCGGCFVNQSDLLQLKHGLHVAPGALQQVVFLTANNGYLGDTGTSDALWIDNESASGLVYGLTFNNTWSGSSSGGSGTLISNTGGGVVNGIHFIGHRVYANAQHGFNIIAGTEITIDDSYICANSLTSPNVYSGISIGAGVTNVAIRNTRSSSGCDGLIGAQAYGFFLGGSNGLTIIQGNNFVGNNTRAYLVAAGTPTGASFIKDNLGIDDAPPNVTAATTMTPDIAEYQVIRGTTTPVTAMTPRWNTQKITFVTFDGTINFNTGGTAGTGPICNAKTAVPFVPFIATYVQSFGCWTLQ